MRCNNCGWDNPAGNKKCEKCFLALTGSMIDDVAHSHGGLKTSDEFNPKKTAKACPNCEYPLMPNVAECSNCGYSLFEAIGKKEEKKETNFNDAKGAKPLKGTIIKGEQTFGDEARKKLVGFLVTYSHSSNGDYFPLFEGTNHVGRDSSNDIVVPDQAVSAEHLVIAYYPQNKKFYFETVGLTQNGTYVNNKFFPKGGDELISLDVIAIGSTKLLFIAIPETTFEM